MPRGKTKLDAAQQVALNEVKESGRAYRQARDELEIRVREQAKEELAIIESQYALAIRRAKDAGIPIVTIGRDGMGSSDPYTPRRWLAKTERAVRATDAVGNQLNAFRWIDKDAGTIRVSIRNFPTSAVDPHDYPQTLEGTVKVEAYGYSVIDDPGTSETELGDLPGWLTWEVENVERETVGSLASMIDAWRAGQ